MRCVILGCHRKADRKKECSYHMRIRLYGMCKNGCTTPAQAKHGYCSRCRIRNDSPPLYRPVGLWINSEKKRYCWSCKNIKKIELFPINKTTPYGRGGMCKDCLINRNRGYRPSEVFEYAEKNVAQGVSCVICGSIENLQIDHIIPQSLGGTNNMDNLQIMCSIHNKKKKNFESIDYRVMI